MAYMHILAVLLLVGARFAVGNAAHHAVAAQANLPSTVFYINLDKSMDRRAHMEKVLSDFPGHVVRVPAVTGDMIHKRPFSHYLQKPGVEHKLDGTSKTGQTTISCWLSHVTLWERLLTELKPHETALILEDDVRFAPDWTNDLNDTLRSAPHDWHVLKVCGWGHDRSTDAVDQNWTVPRWPIWEDGKFFYTGSCGYLVSGSSVQLLLNHVLSQPIKDIDVAMMLPEIADVTRAGIAIYEQRPGRRLLSVGGFASTIRAEGQGYYGYDLPLDSFPGCYNNRHPIRCMLPYSIARGCDDPTVPMLFHQLCCKPSAPAGCTHQLCSDALPSGICTAPSEFHQGFVQAYAPTPSRLYSVSSSLAHAVTGSVAATGALVMITVMSVGFALWRTKRRQGGACEEDMELLYPDYDQESTH